MPLLADILFLMSVEVDLVEVSVVPDFSGISMYEMSIWDAVAVDSDFTLNPGAPHCDLTW